MSRLSPQQLQALFEKGIAAQNAGDFIGAKTHYLDALTHAPNDANILVNLGNLHVAHQRYPEAVMYLGRALETGQVHAGVLKTLGVALTRAGNHTDALEVHRAYRQHEPDDLEIALDYLQSLFTLGNYDNMLAFVDVTPANHPQARLIQVYAAEAEMAQGRPDAAVKRLEAALEKHPNHIELLPAMGKAYGAARNFTHAVEMQRKAVEQAPDDGMHWNNLGNALKNADMNAQALDAFARARTLDARLAAPALVNEAYVHRRLRDMDHAIAAAAEALTIDPLNAAAHFAFGTLNLMHQNYRAAWPHIEWRWHAQETSIIPPPFPLKIWYGEDITGKRLAVYADQGIGDTVQMLRYLPLILEKYQPASLRVYAQKKTGHCHRPQRPRR